MLRKIHVVTVLLLAFVLFGVCTNIGTGYREDDFVIFIYPIEMTDVNVGEIFTISVVSSGPVKNLYAFDIKLKWNPAVVEYYSHVITVPVETHAEGVLNRPFFLIKEQVDSVSGDFWVACSSMAPADPYDCDGVFFTITFRVLSLEDEQPFHLDSIALSDDIGCPIAIYEYEGFWSTWCDAAIRQTSSVSMNGLGRPKGQYESNAGFRKWWLEVVVRAR